MEWKQPKRLCWNVNTDDMRRLYFIICVCFISMVGCDDAYESSIPSITFRFSCNLVQPAYYAIQTPGTFMKVQKNVNRLPVGYAGLIIGKSAFSTLESNDYVAFDAACPVEASRDVSIAVVDDGFGTAVCPTCHTKYGLSNGGFPEGEGTEYLKRYPVTVTGTTLQVQN